MDGLIDGWMTGEETYISIHSNWHQNLSSPLLSCPETFRIEFWILKNKDLLMPSLFFFWWIDLELNSLISKSVEWDKHNHKLLWNPQIEVSSSAVPTDITAVALSFRFILFFSKSYLPHIIMPQRKIHISVRQVCSNWMNWPNIAENQRLVAIRVQVPELLT